jgi:Ca2+-binding RTX toxin-like protein
MPVFSTSTDFATILSGLNGAARDKFLTAAANFAAKAEAGKKASITIAGVKYTAAKGAFSSTNQVTFKIGSGTFDPQATTASINTLGTAIAAASGSSSPTPSPSATQALTATAGETLFGTAGTNDTFTATSATYQNGDIIGDSSTKDADVLNVTVTDDVTAVPITVGVETANFILQAFSTAGTADTFEVAATNLGVSTLTVDLDRAGSSISKAAVTGVKSGVTVTASDDFTGTVSVATGVDDASVTVNAAATTLTQTNGTGTAAAVTLKSTASTAATLTTATDGAATLTTTAAGMTAAATTATTLTATSAGDLVIQAGAATSVKATATGTIDASTAALTAATSVDLTATKNISVSTAAATAATLSAGGTTASTVTDTTKLASLSLSGNGSAHTFNITAADKVAAVTVTGSQNVTVKASAADIDGLTDNKFTFTDSSTGTTTLEVGTAAGDMDLSAAKADVIQLAIDNTGKTATLASAAALTISTDQSGGTLDGVDATKSANTLTIKLDDGAATGAAAVDLTGVTITDLASVTINASTDDAASKIDGLTASANNTSVTVNTGALGVSLANTNAFGTGKLTVNATGAGAVALGTATVNATGGVTIAAGSGGITGTSTLNAGSTGAISVTSSGAVTLGTTTSATTSVSTSSGAVTLGTSNIATSLTVTNTGTGLVTLGAVSKSGTAATAAVTSGSGGVKAGGAIDLGTGTLTVTSSGGIDFDNKVITAASLTASGAGAVTKLDIDSTKLSTVTTGSGADALALTNLTKGVTVDAGGGNDTITVSTNSAASTTYTINGGAGTLDTLLVGTQDISAGTVTLSGIERLSLGNGSKLSAAQISGQSFIVTDAAGTNSFNVIVGTTTTAVDLSALVIDTAQLTAADSFVVDGSAATVALTLKASSIGDSLTGGTVADTITGGSGNDTLTGLAGGDSLVGGAGDDSLDGGVGADVVSGGDGNDTYAFGTAVGANIEGTGTGTATGIVVNLGSTALGSVGVFATTGKYLSGGLSSVAANSVAYLFGTDSASNSSVVDTLSSIENVSGSAGDDYIVGSSSANTITGGAGADSLTGGASADRFVVAAAADSNTTNGVDRITDFAGGTDILDLAVAATGTINTGSAGADLSVDSADVASTGTSVGTLLTDLQTAADALAADEFDHAGDTFVVKITGASLAGTDVFYVVQNTGADTTVTAADTIIALVGTSTAALTVATVV